MSSKEDYEAYVPDSISAIKSQIGNLDAEMRPFNAPDVNFIKLQAESRQFIFEEIQNLSKDFIGNKLTLDQFQKQMIDVEKSIRRLAVDEQKQQNK